jgi:hypothetical protein
MCLARPGWKSGEFDDDDINFQWRLTWLTPGSTHRVAVKPGLSAKVLCDEPYKDSETCQEVSVAECGLAWADRSRQLVMHGGDL